MKTAIIVAFACCITLALAVNQLCKSGDDCGEGECCMKISDYLHPKCKKLKEKDEFCFPRKDWNEKDNTYKFMCPCVEGLICKAEKIEEKDGVTTFKNAKCVEQ